jgi:tetratricopeptide (TPR) repeat protein
MNADTPEPLEESFASWLVAYDEALVAGSPSPDLSGVLAPPELRPRLERGMACLQLLEEVWPRRPAVDPHATPLEKQPTAVTAPTRLGRFTIRREIGRGGYGVVFLAYDPPLGREVALKVPRADVLETAELRQRFYHEARAAAGLDHPNLVPVYDAGEDNGVCYIASPYCPGITLGQWLRLQNEPIPCADAARLVCTLAEAVQHAHSRGIIHRDLKPANVVLQTKGSAEVTLDFPKITDFGLAKLLSESVAQTRSGDIVGTPAYMAPEQAEGKIHAVGTAADVYALGALLYEVLTGRPPFQAQTVLAMLEQVRMQEPVPPRRLRPQLSRDLETICLKCLQKEPARRYAGAHALADDLRRFLAGEPVQARPVGGVERLGRWCRRKPALAGLSAALAAAVVVGFVLVAWQWWRAEVNAREAHDQRGLAEAQRQKAHQAVNDYFAQVSENKLLGKPGLQPLRKELLETALRYYQEFLQERGDDPAMRAETAATYVKVATVYDHTGSKNAAKQAYREALALYGGLADADAAEPRWRRQRGRVCIQLGALHSETGEPEEAADYLGQALALLERLVADHPDATEFQGDLTRAHFTLSQMHDRLGRRAEALAGLQRAHAVQEQIARARPGDRGFQMELADTENSLGTAYLNTKDMTRARHWFQEAQARYRRLVQEQPTADSYQHSLATACANLGGVARETGRLDEAIRSYLEARDLWERLVHENPTVTDYLWNLAQAYYRLALYHRDSGKRTEAVRLHKEARPLFEKLIRLNPTVPEYQYYLASTYLDVGHIQSMTPDHAEALPAFRQACARFEELVRAHPGVPSYRLALSSSTHNLGNELWKRRQKDEALRAFERCLDVTRNLAEADRGNRRYQNNLVWILRKLGSFHDDEDRPAESTGFYRQAIAVCDQLVRDCPEVPDYERLLATCHESLGDRQRKDGELDQAEGSQRRALAIREKFLRSHPGLADVHKEAAQSYSSLGWLRRECSRPAEALPLYERACELFDEALRLNPGDLRTESGAATAWDGRGLALARLGRYGEALAAHCRAIDGQRAVRDKAPDQPEYQKKLTDHYRHLLRLCRDLGRL